jgi:hypothetical protein
VILKLVSANHLSLQHSIKIDLHLHFFVGGQHLVDPLDTQLEEVKYSHCVLPHWFWSLLVDVV